MNKVVLSAGLIAALSGGSLVTCMAQPTVQPAASPTTQNSNSAPAPLTGGIPGAGATAAPSSAAVPTISSPTQVIQTLPSLPSVPSLPGNACTPAVPAMPSSTAATSSSAGLPSAITGSPAVPGGALSATTAGAPETANGLSPTTPPPLMGTITQEVAFTLDKQEVRRGPFTGVVVHLHNGTDSPLVFDGDRAIYCVGAKKIAAVTDAALELMVAQPPGHWLEAKIGLIDFATVGWFSTISDEIRSRGPILPRYGADQMRRESTSERFGMRIMWPGEDTEGIIFFRTDASLSGGQMQLPVVTFPSMEIRGYLTCVK